jgi:ribosomal protein S18 acetylase RimI-like enzyme
MVDSPPPIRIVPARGAHRGFVRRLSADVLSRFGDYEVILPGMMQLPWMLTVAALASDRPVGFAMYSLEDLRHGEVELSAIAVDPAWQSRGVGRALLEWVERAARLLAPAENPVSVRLTVAEDNDRARRLFERSGYCSVQGGEGFYPAGQRSLVLRKVLSGSALDSGSSGPKVD